MRRLYQTEWQGILFRSFARLDAEQIAGPEFYDRFYNALFSRYERFEELPSAYREQKARIADHIASRMRHPSERLLAFGCGLGAVERRLLELHVQELHVVEASRTALRWLEPRLNASRLHVGSFPGCLDSNERFDLSYLVAVDYCFEQDAWVELLRGVRERLRPGGRCVMVSASYDNGGWRVRIRDIARTLLYAANARHPGQFWGYLRTRSEYRGAMEAAGFEQPLDGFLQDGTYWVEGTLPSQERELA